MNQSNNFKKTVLFLGDIALFYMALFITLSLRSLFLPSFSFLSLWNLHIAPFSIINSLLILIFYIAGLYSLDSKKFANFFTIAKTIGAGAILAIIFFYFIPYFRITPKTNLFVYIIVTYFLIWLWRISFLEILARSSKTKVFFLGESKETDEFSIYIKNNSQLGYSIGTEISTADIIIVSEEIKQNPKNLQMLYEIILTGKSVINFDKFYESITGKIPVSMISEIWFLENLMEIKKQSFEKFKRIFDILLSIILFPILLIILPFAFLAIKTSGKGPVFYFQNRVGKNRKIFKLIKFRSMVQNAEKNGAEWAREKDNRITMAGNFLRKTRIDELPQIWNILKGNLSFIGPRPERPEFTNELTKKIPHYSIRHLVKPGLSGWAQVNFPYGASVEDAMQKLQYDLYYIKNRSIILEFSILLKTILTVLSRAGR